MSRRERFEQHASQSGLSLARADAAMMFLNGRRLSVGDYIMPDTAAAWSAWNEALDQVVVELPVPHGDYQRFNDSEIAGACKYFEIAKQAFIKAGLEVKS